jgi:hypothetical protein
MGISRRTLGVREYEVDLGGGSASLTPKESVPRLLSSHVVLLPKKSIFTQASKMLGQATRRGWGSELESRRLGSNLSEILHTDFREDLSLLKNPSTPLPSPVQGLKYPAMQCFGLDVKVFRCGFGLPTGPMTTFSTA